MKFENEKDRDYYVKEDPVHDAFAKSIGEVVQTVRYVRTTVLLLRKYYSLYFLASHIDADVFVILCPAS